MAAQGPGLSWQFYERHFAQERLRHYLNDCNGDQALAAELYRWNSAVSGAFWEGLSYFEVSIRNAIDARMSARHAKKGRTGHWIFDDARELGRDRFGVGNHQQPYLDVDRAKKRVSHNGMPMTAGQVMSELSFGFWHQMVSKKQKFLWPDLASAFPHAPNRAQPTVHDPVQRLRDLRNRVGHHHRVWSLNLAALHDDMLDVAGYVDPDLRTFVAGRSRVPMLLSNQPGVARV